MVHAQINSSIYQKPTDTQWTGSHGASEGWVVCTFLCCFTFITFTWYFKDVRESLIALQSCQQNRSQSKLSCKWGLSSYFLVCYMIHTVWHYVYSLHSVCIGEWSRWNCLYFVNEMLMQCCYCCCCSLCVCVCVCLCVCVFVYIVCMLNSRYFLVLVCVWLCVCCDVDFVCSLHNNNNVNDDYY